MASSGKRAGTMLGTCGRLPRRAHPIRAPAVAATGGGNVPPASGCTKRVMATRPRRLRPSRKSSSGATAPRACRLRVGIQAKNDAASADRLCADHDCGALRAARIPIRAPAVAAAGKGGWYGNSAPLLARIASGGCWRGDPAVRQVRSCMALATVRGKRPSPAEDGGLRGMPRMDGAAGRGLTIKPWGRKARW
jgi:hypothetical protein